MKKALALVPPVLLILAATVQAHHLGADCAIRGSKVEVETFYDDDTPARQARVVVKDSDGKVVAEGRTDEKGNWRFPTPKPGRYRVNVDAGSGHSTSVAITIPASKPVTRNRVARNATDCPRKSKK